MKVTTALGALALALASGFFVPLTNTAAPVRGWLNWRGPQQNGSSLEKNLPEKLEVNDALWVADFPGQSTPVVANGKLYIMGYLGEGPDLQEGVACLDAERRKKLWQRLYNDSLSDTIYQRYATSSATVDSETGDVFMQGTQGILAAFNADGQLLWRHSLMEEFGRLTFPNSRTASPVIDQDLVITRGITANWGAQGPAADRFYAFDKKTGELVWAANPGDRPKDNSFSHPYLGWLGGKRVFYSATGDGSVVCVNARTGDALWRVPLFKAGINATVLVHNTNKVIAVYGTPYEPGQMVALKILDVEPTNAAAGPVVLERSKVQLWAVDLSTSASAPILAGDTAYIVTEKGDLCAVDANSGKILWKIKLGIEERNACPLYADGKLYVPMLDDPASKAAGGEAGTTGAFYIIKPGDKPEILTHIALDGRCFGTPTAYNGKVYIQTTRHVYCFGKKGEIRGRVLRYLPIEQDFEWFTLSETNIEGTAFAYPPLPWIGARFKFDVRDKEGDKVMAKTTDNRFFQRATVFIGAPDAKNYTIEADVMSDGNKRKMSEVGSINQRYIVVLKGNEQKLEINSNQERLRVAEDFKWLPNVWYRLKARVEIAPDSSGVVRAKAWKKGEPEPEKWVLEVPHKTAHQNGSPGLFGFSPQDMRVYIGNVKVTAN